MAQRGTGLRVGLGQCFLSCLHPSFSLSLSILLSFAGSLFFHLGLMRDQGQRSLEASVSHEYSDRAMDTGIPSSPLAP
jgi:hypothetical protein